MATAIPATCEVVNDLLLKESGRLAEPVFRRAVAQDPIIGLMARNRGAWRNGMGTVVGAVTFERSFPASSGDTWTDIGASDGADANACLPPVEDIEFGQTSRTYQPRHKAFESPDFCIRDISTSFAYADMLRNISRVLGDISAWEWGNHYTNDYVRLAGHKITVNIAGGLQDSSSAYSTANPATGKLTQGILDDIYTDLSREGSSSPYGWDETTDSPVYVALISKETEQMLLRNNPDIRDDIRYAYMGKGMDSPLMRRMQGGKPRVYGGFVYKIKPFPRRFILNAGAYEQIEPFISSSTTKGTKWERNPAYKVAPYEETIIFHDETYQSLAVNNVSNPAPGWEFGPVNYMGDFRWVNEYHRTCNPDRTIGFWRAVMADAAKPINPQVGYTILHARCGIDLNLSNCYTS